MELQCPDSDKLPENAPKTDFAAQKKALPSGMMFFRPKLIRRYAQRRYLCCLFESDLLGAGEPFYDSPQPDSRGDLRLSSSSRTIPKSGDLTHLVR